MENLNIYGVKLNSIETEPNKTKKQHIFLEIFSYYFTKLQAPLLSQISFQVVLNKRFPLALFGCSYQGALGIPLRRRLMQTARLQHRRLSA